MKPTKSQVVEPNSTIRLDAVESSTSDVLSVASIGADRVTQVVDPSTASEATRRYRQAPDRDLRKGGYFSRAIFAAIMRQKSCDSIEFYLARENDGALTIVLIGSDRRQAHIQSGIWGENVIPCPPVCPALNALNSDITTTARVSGSRKIRFTGNESHFITTAEGLSMIRRFSLAGSPGGFQAVSFTTSQIRAILAQPNCVGIRIYFAKQAEGDDSLVLVGVNQFADDMVHDMLLLGIATPRKISLR